jgi:two-component system chemotaxis response regulator CheB
MIKAQNPDVVTLDVEMPHMDGLEFLEKLMRKRPIPVVMVSTRTEKGSDAALRDLELIVVDFVSKPKIDVAKGMMGYAEEITSKTRIAAKAKVKQVAPTASEGKPSTMLPLLASCVASTTKLIIVGASTGGTEAPKELPPNTPGILIARHMPEAFAKSFANRLNRLCKIEHCDAQGGERFLPDHAFVAPGHSRLLLKRSGANYMVELSQSERVNRHWPSVDVLFDSPPGWRVRT